VVELTRRDDVNAVGDGMTCADVDIDAADVAAADDDDDDDSF
jgi:hypothetical protein